jgi:hypothetical protein
LLELGLRRDKSGLFLRQCGLRLSQGSADLLQIVVASTSSFSRSTTFTLSTAVVPSMVRVR